jgi:pimeloyl-ACP methyl ester carboxylesterase
MDEVVIKGQRIAFERRGDGPPLVLLHGALSDSRAWRRQIEGLSDEFTVVAWDALGCGQSADPPETYRLQDYADCLAGFMAALGLRKPNVLGLSFGGGLALELYRRHSTVPKTLILVSAYAGWAGSLAPETVQNRLRNGLKQSELPPEEVTAAWLPTLFEESVPADVVAETAEIMSGFHPVGMRAMLRAFAEADLRGMLGTIEVPTLLIYGDADKRSPLSVAHEMHSKIAQSELKIVAGVGHMVNAEVPDALNDQVRGFLKSHLDFESAA